MENVPSLGRKKRDWQEVGGVSGLQTPGSMTQATLQNRNFPVPQFPPVQDEDNNSPHGSWSCGLDEAKQYLADATVIIIRLIKFYLWLLLALKNYLNQISLIIKIER